jgi:hypothetical protein
MAHTISDILIELYYKGSLIRLEEFFLCNFMSPDLIYSP